MRRRTKKTITVVLVMLAGAAVALMGWLLVCLHQFHLDLRAMGASSAARARQQLTRELPPSNQRSAGQQSSEAQASEAQVAKTEQQCELRLMNLRGEVLPQDKNGR